LVDLLEFNSGVTDPRQRFYFHTLRHTFAWWLAIQGEPLLTIKELLGHKTLVMTMRYTHLMPDQKRKAVERLVSSDE
jgi:integrase